MRISIRRIVKSNKVQQWMNPYVAKHIITTDVPETIKSERDFIKFIKQMYGSGVYSILLHQKYIKGWQGLFYGSIEEDKWIRYRGIIRKFFMDEKQNQWHKI